MRYTISTSESAEADLHGIAEYISGILLIPETAEEIVESLITSIESLEFFPKRYPRVLDDLRKMTVKNYIIFYSVCDATQIVRIVRVLCSRREWQGIRYIKKGMIS